ncbi:hypothetical protein KGF57_001524 [Candida theae]|uniref:Uncharacterized protein n=1 Tax=Candida theae TaxID=1198502 RepID=A0AAD5BHD4_9ASCO|nr:uncharacterized protein KGF57_001524 [Candida theae]KAI5961985.1 hypothetical protein KGF57_001524 [Candida theae]
MPRNKQGSVTFEQADSRSNLRSQQPNGDNFSHSQSNTSNVAGMDHDADKSNHSTNGTQPGQENGRRITKKFIDINSTDGSTPIIDTGSVKSYFPDNSWQEPQSPSEKHSRQRLSSAPKKTPPVFPMSNKNRSDSSIKTPRYNQHKRSSTASSTSSITTPPLVSRSSDNLRILLDKDRKTPPALLRDDGGGGSGYFNLDRSKWKGNVASSIITSAGGKSDRLKPSIVGDSPGLLSSPWFRDLKRGNSNANISGSSANIDTSSVNTSTQSLHAHKMEQSNREQKNRLVDQFLSSSKKVPPSPGSEMMGSRYFNEDLLPSSISNSHVNLSALTPLKPLRGNARGDWRRAPDDLSQEKEVMEQVSREERLQRLLDHEVNIDEKAMRLEKQERNLESEEKKIQEEAPQVSSQMSPKQEPRQQPEGQPPPPLLPPQKQFESVLNNLNGANGSANNTALSNVSEELVNNVLSNGGFRFEYDTKHVIEDDKLVNYLINIDNVLEELEKRKHHMSHRRKQRSSSTDDEEYGELVKILTTISEKVAIKTKAMIYAKANPAKATILQLDLVSRYLTTLHDSMNQLREQLVMQLTQTRDKNSEVISDNLTKLNNIDSDLKKLEETTNRYKDKIIQQKQLMKTEMNGKLTLLEEINKQVHIHNQNKRHTRMIRLNVVFAGLIILLGIYLGVRR